MSSQHSIYILPGIFLGLVVVGIAAFGVTWAFYTLAGMFIGIGIFAAFTGGLQ